MEVEESTGYWVGHKCVYKVILLHQNIKRRESGKKCHARNYDAQQAGTAAYRQNLFFFKNSFM